MRTSHHCIAVAVAALSLRASCRAADILDQQLQPDPPKVFPGIINPAAAKAVDDADLVRKLTNPDGEKPAEDPSEKLKDMVDHMGQSQSRLTQKDVGAVTQETQRRIVTDLDVLIEIVRKQQEQSKSQPKSAPQPGEKRDPTQSQNHSAKPKPGTNAAQDSQLSNGEILNPPSNGTQIQDKGPAEWGNLPPKDRDLISNGVNEQYLPAYKEMIDRYYQALAEIGKTKDKP